MRHLDPKEADDLLRMLVEMLKQYDQATTPLVVEAEADHVADRIAFSARSGRHWPFEIRLGLDGCDVCVFRADDAGRLSRSSLGFRVEREEDRLDLDRMYGLLAGLLIHLKPIEVTWPFEIGSRAAR